MNPRAVVVAAVCLFMVGRVLADPVGAASRATDDETRVVRHALGETRVPARAARVITLSFENTEDVLALGLVPVGAVSRFEGGFFPAGEAQLHATREVGTEDEPNLAAIASLRPDLILGLKLRQAALFPQLSAIAPTVFCDTLRGRWRENLRLWGEALGRQSEATALLADWQERIEAARRAFPGAPRTRVAVLRFMPTMLRIYHQDSFAMSILAEIDFAPSEFKASNNYFEALPVSRIQELTSTAAIFYFRWDDATHSALERERNVTARAPWTDLPAVQGRRAYPVDDGTWNTSGGILSARRMLDDLAARLDERHR